jgi:threonine dehydratase
VSAHASTELVFPTLNDAEAAAAALDGVARETPVLTDGLLDEATGSSVHVKAEFLQRGGAYKFRGIFNRVRLLSEDERRRGIVTISSGNAGIAAAYAARLLGTSCVVVMPAEPALQKLAAIEALGGRVVRHGSSSIEMAARAAELTTDGRVLVHPFDQAEVIAGQATMALELLEQAPGLDVVVAPTAGGGMLAGIALVLHELGSDLELVGVQPEGAAALHRSLAAGAVTECETVDTLADGLAVKRCGELTFQLIRRRVNAIVLVSDDDILTAVALYWRLLHVAVEPAGAAALAALLRHTDLRGRRVGVLASGGNIDVRLLQHALAGGSAQAWKATANG